MIDIFVIILYAIGFLIVGFAILSIVVVLILYAGFLISVPAGILFEKLELKYNMTADRYEQWWRKKLQ